MIPQTSTIASHLPRAVGVAFAIDRARKLGVASEWPADAIAVTSFGDASANHSTATGAINAACQAAYQGLPMPVLFVCEDNGLGISVRDAGRLDRGGVRQPAVAAVLHRRRHDLAACYDAALAAAAHVRTKRAPGVPAPARGALHGPRRQRRRDQLPQLRPRSPPTTTATRCSAPRGCWSAPGC